MYVQHTHTKTHSDNIQYRKEALQSANMAEDFFSSANQMLGLEYLQVYV